VEILLLAIYALFAWLICVKLKWLPWNITTQVGVVIIPVLGLTATLLLLNVFAPSSSELRVYKYTVPIVSQVKGRVTEVAVEEGNRLVKKGDVLFRIDPTPYQLEVAVLEAQLFNAQTASRELEESAKLALVRLEDARGAIVQAEARTREVSARLGLARKRADEYRELVKSGIGNRFMLERAEADVKELEGQRTASLSAELQARDAQARATAGEKKVEHKLGARVNGEFAQLAQVRAQVAQLRAQLEHAKWLLGETTTRSPCDCFVVSLQLRPGAFVAGSALNPAMTLVEAGGEVVALYSENALHAVMPGNEVEFALKKLPGKIIMGKVGSVIWAPRPHQASEAAPVAGVAAMPPGRYAVRFEIAEHDKALFLAAGATGDAAIYTEHLRAVHILRKVSLRVGSYLNYLIPKLQ
jgi:multidrug resistance efflux pump